MLNKEIVDSEMVKLGYKFLGWENGWGYPKEPIERTECRKAGHSMDDIQHNARGSENTRICHKCKTYSKYDCSD